MGIGRNSLKYMLLPDTIIFASDGAFMPCRPTFLI